MLIIGGLTYALLRHGIPLGIDFSGGTMVVLQFDAPVHEDAVRAALDTVPGDKVVQKYGDDAAHQILIRLPEVKDAEQGFSLEQGAKRTVEAIQKAGLPKFQVISTEVVGPIVGADLQRRASTSRSSRSSA